MPVLPDDGSMIVLPGVSVPSASASAIMLRAMRSLTEPAGLLPSSLARMRTRGLGLRLDTSTTGVLPDELEHAVVDAGDGEHVRVPFRASDDRNPDIRHVDGLGQDSTHRRPRRVRDAQTT